MTEKKAYMVVNRNTGNVVEGVWGGEEEFHGLSKLFQTAKSARAFIRLMCTKNAQNRSRFARTGVVEEDYKIVEVTLLADMDSEIDNI